MSNIFQRLKTPGEAVEPRLTLAAFGKHPGWDDHLPGIGVETELLARVKESLYVDGIGGQIDSGAWQKLESAQRMEGFDHSFLWLQAGNAVYGQMWSSTDGKGRSKYPMIVCVHGENVSPAFLIRDLRPGLERLRESCKASTTAEQVIGNCQATRDLLRAQLAAGGKAKASESGISPAARRQFVEERDFMPDRLGLMRVLHELGGLAEKTPAGSGSPCRHLRVPLASAVPTESLLLWGDFFRMVVSPKVQVLVINRGGNDWLDAIIGVPDTSDFFCLQASLAVLPLTSEIPYDLSPELKRRWIEVEAQYLDDSSLLARKNASPPPTKPAPAAAAPETDRRSEASSGFKIWPFALIALVGVAAVGGYFLYQPAGTPKSPQAAHPAAPAPTNATAVKAPAVGEDDYRNAMKLAQAAFERKDYSGAVSQASIALDFRTNDSEALNLKAKAESLLLDQSKQQKYDSGIAEIRAALHDEKFAEAISRADALLITKPADPVATGLRQEALARQQELARLAKLENDYSSALAAGHTAFDHGEFDSALKQAGIALGIKPKDAAASKLRSDAQAQLDLAAATAASQKQYDASMTAANAAFSKSDYTTAAAQAKLALGSKPSDPAATKLAADAQAKLDQAAAAAELRRKADVEIAAAKLAMERKDYSNALAKASVALVLENDDPTALKLKHDAEAALQVLQAQAAQDQKFRQALTAAQTALDQNDYAKALAQVDQALLVRTNDPAAIQLRRVASEGKDLQDARRYASNGDYEKARGLCAAHTGTPAFDELAKTLSAKQLDTFDTELEAYMVRFGLLDAKNATSPQARKESRVLGEFTIPARDQYFQDVETLRAAFKASGRLDAAREKQLNDLKTAIHDHQ